MSPLAFKVLLHFYVTPVQLDRNAMSDPQLDALAGFIADGMIEPRDGGEGGWDSHQISEKGRVWIEAMLNTPYPEQRWVVPRDRHTVCATDGCELLVPRGRK